VNPEGGKRKPFGFKDTTMSTRMGKMRAKMIMNVTREKMNFPTSNFCLIFINPFYEKRGGELPWSREKG
jgi:hypothetical protein